MSKELFGQTTSQPTPQQRLWGDLFLGVWYLVQATGAGSGKTWFWRQVIRFIETQEPWMKHGGTTKAHLAGHCDCIE